MSDNESLIGAIIIRLFLSACLTVLIIAAIHFGISVTHLLRDLLAGA